MTCLWETSEEPHGATLDPDVRLGRCPVVDCPSRAKGKGRTKAPLATFRRVSLPSG